MATLNGQPIAVGTTLRRVRVMRGGEPAAPQAIEVLSAGESVEGLELGEDETIALGMLDGVYVDARIVALPARKVRRRALSGSLRALADAVRTGDVCDPQHTQRLLLALCREHVEGG